MVAKQSVNGNKEYTMFLNFICFIIGAFTGMVLTCLAVAASREDDYK